MKTAYEHKDGEIIYTPTGEKVATWDGEKHRMARGFAEEHSESVAAWIPLNLQLGVPVSVGTEPAPDPAPAADNPLDDLMARYGAETPPVHPLAPAKKASDNPAPPKPEGAPELGEKDPVVIAWMEEHGSDEDRAKVLHWRSRGLKV